jgi:2-amino-4-hydroxy-6-hydroxymethyldihydropteridine diphosphokinase
MLLLGLGSNIGDRRQNLTNAIILLSEIVGEVKAISNLYETSPEGFASPNDFLNAAVAIQSDLLPEETLARCKAIEREMGRQPKQSDEYEDRLIDIDILFHGDLVHHSETLHIPHPMAHCRRFVLQPLAEIAPDFLHPELKATVKELLDKLDN